MPFSQRIAEELAVRPQQVAAAVSLLDEGATVPFIARYRKEVTGGLDDIQLRALEERLRYLREMEERRQAIIKSIDEQGKLSDALKHAIDAADTKQALEDIYLPYKPKRRTRAQIAREAGLESLADALFSDPTLNPQTQAEAYIDVDNGVDDTKAALDGARYILMERFAEDAKLLGRLRDFLGAEAQLSARLMEGKENEAAKFRDYFEHDEALDQVPSHRALAMFRGRNEGFLALTLVVPQSDEATSHPAESIIANHWGIEQLGRVADKWLAEVVRWTWRVKLSPQLESELLASLRERAEEEAISVFASNLKDLLMAAPAGNRPTLGLDPGLRTGVKVAVVDGTGQLVDHTAIFPTAPQRKTREGAAVLVALCKKYDIELVAIGNGTASRETDQFVADLMNNHPELNISRVIVNESGASIYSASEFASREMPDVDVTIRGAASIARRLQDPLSELVKIEPKAIGVGQYQHDVSQVGLARQLDNVVEDCVNAVGVDVNTASAPLLTRISGLNRLLAENIVSYRNHNGPFKSRKALKSVPRLGDKTFEQAAGFLRIHQGDNPLDASAVHPESYSVVESIAANSERNTASLIGDSTFIRSVKAADYVSDKFGLPTVTDILAELDKPGRDPRPEFKTARFTDGVEKVSDLRPDMVLEGTVTNVTNFGAFVDVGVHQDGLVHISQLANRFVKDPREVVKAGDIVRVKVVEVDTDRKRIALTMRLDEKIEVRNATEQRRGNGGKKSQQRAPRPAPADKAKVGSFGQLLANAVDKAN